MKDKKLLNYYISLQGNASKHQAIEIISAICTSQFPTPTKEFATEIEELVEHIKKTDINTYEENINSTLIKLYLEIIESKIKNKQNDIKTLLSKEQKSLSNTLSKKIFKLNKELIYVASCGDNTYTNQLTNVEDLSTIISTLICAGAGVIIFYENVKDKQKVFGFKICNKKIEEIAKEELMKLAPNRTPVFTTFSEISYLPN